MSVHDLSGQQLSPEELELFELLLQEEVAEEEGIPRRTDLADLPLSFAQQRLWFIHQLDSGSAAYNMPIAVRLRGRLDVAALGRSLREIVRRHEVLRSIFTTEMGQPRQRLLPRQAFSLRVVDLRELPERSRGVEAQLLTREEAQRPFDLERGPLLRNLLVACGDEESLALLTLHHIVGDAWSLGLLTRELASLYTAFAQDLASPLPELEIQYADFAAWQRERLGGGALDPELAYWRERLAVEPPALDLPVDRPRSAVPTSRGASLPVRLPRRIVAGLAAMRPERYTLFMSLLAGFQALLHRYSGQDDIAVGTPVAGRTQVQTENLIGCFLNTLVLRTDLSGDPSFVEVLEQVRDVTLGAFSHQELPFEQLVSELQPERQLSRTPLFQVFFVLQNVPAVSFELPDLRLAALPTDSGATKFDLTLRLAEGAGVLTGVLEYRQELFEDATAGRLLAHLKVLLAGIVEDPRRRLSILPLLTAAERHQLLVDWNDTEEGKVSENCLHALFAAQIRGTPDHVAAVFEEGSLTYAELERRSNRLAHHLRRLGVGPEVRVALCFERSLEMVIALLGVLKAGGTYAPLDPNSPQERLAAILEDLGQEGGPPPLLTQAGLTGRLPLHGGPVLRLDADWPQIAGPENEPPASGVTACHAAYILYTSGSTGLPKGVIVEHRQIVNYLRGLSARLGLAPEASAAMVQPLSVDACKSVLYTPLLIGGTLHLISEEQALDAERLSEYLRRHAVDALKIAPSHLIALQNSPESVLPRGWLVLGGEASRWEWARALSARQAGCRVFNHYGPTEATVGMLVNRVVEDGVAGPSGTTPLGRPLPAARIHLLDRAMQPVPIGVSGELHIGGACVARGYLGRPDLTAERFVPDPFAAVAGGRLYRTGDLARHLADGRVEFLGRFDHQVKIRGFRIELGEIEAALGRHPEVREAVVAAQEDEGGMRLVAYLLPRGGVPPDPAELHRYAREKLPGYMVPAAFVFLADLPRNSHGKLDRKRLPAPGPVRLGEKPWMAPRNTAEEKLAEIWQRILRLERVGVYDNFFELGGDSILSIQVIARAAAVGLRLTPRQIFEHPTVAGLAAVAQETTDAPVAASWSAAPVPLTPIQRRFFEQDLFRPEHYNQAVLLAAGPLAGGLLGQALDHVVAHHDALRVRFDRPRPEEAYRQRLDPNVGGPPLVWMDLAVLPLPRQREALEQAASCLQASFDLLRGPLLRAAFFTLGSQPPCRLLLAVHHLVVDGVSWRILLEDLETAYRQLAAGGAVSLPAKTSSYQSWAERLSVYAGSQELAAQAACWRFAGRAPRLPLAHGAGTAADAVRVTTALGPSETRALLRDVPRAYHTQINDVLLTALVEAFGGWTGGRRLLIDLEGHGREAIFPDLDLSRTVGWFTSVYPVLLDITEAAGPGEALRTVKEQLRAIPEHGIGYGVLRYLGMGEEAEVVRALPRAEVLFNYLGQLDQALPAGSLFQAAEEAVGALRDRHQSRAYAVEINGSVGGGRLQLTWTCDVRDRKAVETWAQRFREVLLELIDHCQSSEAGGYTPSDFPLARLNQSDLDRLADVAHGAIEDLYPVSPVQQGMIFHSLHSPWSGVYVEQLSIRLSVGLDVGAFERSWERVVQRHPVLRTSFHGLELARPLQLVHPRVELSWDHDDWRRLAAAEQELSLADYLAADRRRGFDLTRPPLLRLALIRLGEESYQFVWSHHHILTDGWSTSILLTELFAVYEAEVRGGKAELGPARPYRDFIAWLEGQDTTAAETFWRRSLQGFEEPAPLGLPALPGAGDPQAAERCAWLPEPGIAALQAFARAHQLTLASVVQGAWALLLGRYGGTEDVLFGAVTSGRSAPLPGIESMVGLFINTLPVRVRLPGADELVSWLRSLLQEQAEMRQYEHSRLTEIQGWSEIPRGRPFFESILVFENYPVDATLGQRVGRSLRIGGAEVAEQTHYPLCLEVAPGSRLMLKALYDGRRFDSATIDRLLHHLQTLLAELPSREGERLATLSLLSPDERHQLLLEVGGGPARPRPGKGLHHWVGTWARLRPEASAVVDGTAVLTYGELNASSNRLARRLRELGVRPDHPVGIALERCPEMVIAVLAVLKAGGAYLPLDPAYPQERLAFMLRDALAGPAPAVVLTQERLAERFQKSAAGRDPAVCVLCLDTAQEDTNRLSKSDLDIDCDPANLAYAIYTSGSTGVSKGVAMTRQAVENLLAWQEEEGGLSGPARTLQFASLSFDVSFQEIFSTWRTGGTLCLIPEETRRDASALLGRLAEWRIERLFLPFVALRHLAEAAEEGRGGALCLRDIVTAGEQLQVTPAMVRWLGRLPNCRLHNHYGPAETHVVTAATLGGDPADWPPLPPIGRPIAGTTILLLDRSLNPVPTGIQGELYVGGAALARGYLHRPEVTAVKFVPDPFGHLRGEPGARLYKTGDLARWLPEVGIEYLGRLDQQVKIRGFRVEPGEVEAALSLHPAVQAAVVLASPEPRSGGKRLIAYVVPAKSVALVPGEIRSHLRSRLPEHMVPSAFVVLDAFPLTPSGKLDRRALPDPDLRRAESWEAAANLLDEAGSANPITELVASIWSDVLGCDRVLANDDFFELGGHSLLAIQVVARVRALLGVDVPLQSLFERSTLWRFAELVQTEISSGTRSAPPPIAPIARGGDLPLSFAQQRLWFVHQLDAQTRAYNLTLACRLEGRLQISALGASLDEIVRRHEPLRTTFHQQGEEAWQRIARPTPVPLPVVDLSGLCEPARAQESSRLMREERNRCFNLVDGPLFRVLLLLLGGQEQVVQLTMHHIVSDGWSMGVLVRELSALYGAVLRQSPSPLLELAVQYADYAVWQRQWLSGEVLEAELGYWRQRLGEQPPVLELPTDRPRPAMQTIAGANQPVWVRPELLASLRSLARRQGATLFMLLLAAFEALLERYSGQEDFVVGTPVAGRNRTEIEGLIGFFVNMLVLRADLGGDPGFVALLGRVRETALSAYAHQDLPFEKLISELQPERDPSRTPLFQVVFVLQNAPVGELSAPGLTFRAVPIESTTAKFDLTLALFESHRALTGAVQYNRDLFDGTTAGRLAIHFDVLLAGLVENPQRCLSDLPFATSAECHQILVDWNDTEPRWSTDDCLHTLFSKQVLRSPESLAVVCEEQSLSYAELDRRSNRLAQRLRGLGVGPEVRVALCFDRSLEMVIAILGVLKAGGAYVPLDPASPSERLRQILDDLSRNGEAPPLLTRAALSDHLPAYGGALLRLDRDGSYVEGAEREAPASGAGPESSAYVLYTAGSTGPPKGVVVEHRQIVNYLRAIAIRLDLGPAVSTAMLQPLTVDSCKTALFPPLLSGGALHLIPERLALDSQGLADYFERTAVGLLKIAPSHLAALQTSSARPVLPRDWLVIGGESSSWDWALALTDSGAGCRVFNHYGPTEATVGMLAGRVTPGRAVGSSGTTPLGRPLAGTRVYLLDRVLEAVPIGGTGELYAGGACVARGYDGRPDLTAERFVPDRFAAVAGSRLYWTGDLARFLPDGRVEFVGRFDQQVKIRGFRIELGEIESVLGRHPGVREAVVAAREAIDGTKRLVAYLLACGESPPDPAELQRYAREKLPAYMVPAAFVWLAELPRTSHGKLDRKALPTPELASAGLYEAPRNPVEEMLVEIWADLLGVERVGVDDNFFDLGGHSLLAMRVVSRVRGTFGMDLPLIEFFERPTLAQLAASLASRLREGAGAPPPPLNRADRNRPLPLSFAQQRLWFLDQLQPAGAAYNVPIAVRLEGDLDVAALQAALSEVGRRHEALRTTFDSTAGEPVQVIGPHRQVPVPVLDLHGLPAAARARELVRLVRLNRQLPFDLQRGPLLRSALLRIGPGEHAVLLAAHHIVSDGWSMGVLVRELSALYVAALRLSPSPLPELAVQYADYAVWQRQWLSGEALAAELGYWRERLGERPPVLELPTDRPRPAVQTFAGANQPVRVGPEILAGLRSLARRQGATLFMLLLAAFEALLARYSGQDEFVVGTPVAGRNRTEVEGLIGFFVNMLVLRADLGGDPGFMELLDQVRKTALSAYAHQDLPFEKLVLELQPERDLSRTPLFQVAFALQNAPLEALSVPGLTFRPVPSESTTAKFDLTLALSEVGPALTGAFEFNRDLFDRASVRRMADHLRVLLSGLAEAPQKRVSELSLLTVPERQEVLLEWNDTAKACPAQPLVHERFSEHARRRPEATAISSPQGQLSYGEVESLSNRLAHHLRSLGVGPEVLVALATERTLVRVVGIVAVLKAGGAYVSLDPTYPRERLSFLLEDAGAPVLLTERRFMESLPESAATVLCLDGDWEEIRGEEWWAPATAVEPNNLAYVVYTSGSTGRPKGVEIPHAGLTNLVRWHQDLYGVVAADRGTQIASPAFDASIWELWPYLAAGASVHVPQEETRLSSAGMVRWWSEQEITLAYLMTPLAEGVLEEEIPADLPLRVRALIIGGDRLHRGPSPGAGFRLMNHYGPAEYTVTSTVTSVPEQGELSGAPSIGRPVDNTRIYVLDRQGQPVPAGVPGELYVAGLGLARGYLRRPDLTAEKFVPDPFAPLWGESGGRMYRTADLVRWLAGGELDFLGRLDHQVKVRGLRIELGEIEAALGQHPCVQEVAVLVREDRPGDKRLVGYLVPAGGEQPSVEDLRTFLGERLPAYMVPMAFVVLAALPLTPNGKVDRRALPAPQWAPEREFVPPRTSAEERLAAIWQEVLRVDRVGVHDNFFDLGGHSLLATRVVTRVRNAFSIELSLASLFEAPTVAELAERLAAAGASLGMSDLDKVAQALEQLQGLSESEVLALLEEEQA